MQLSIQIEFQSSEELYFLFCTADPRHSLLRVSLYTIYCGGSALSTLKGPLSDLRQISSKEIETEDFHLWK